MKYTSYKLIYLERIDTTFNQILCQSFYIPQYSLNIHSIFTQYSLNIYNA